MLHLKPVVRVQDANLLIEENRLSVCSVYLSHPLLPPYSPLSDHSVSFSNFRRRRLTWKKQPGAGQGAGLRQFKA